MKIAFDLRRIENPGVGRYMQCLVGAIVREAPQHEYFFIMSPGTRHMLDCTNQGIVLPLSGVPLRGRALVNRTRQGAVSALTGFDP